MTPRKITCIPRRGRTEEKTTYISHGVKEEGVIEGIHYSPQLGHIAVLTIVCAGDHSGRQRRRQDQLNEPICTFRPDHPIQRVTDPETGQQEVFHLLQSHHRRRLPHQRSVSRRPPGHDAAVGHRGTGALPELGRGVL